MPGSIEMPLSAPNSAGHCGSGPPFVFVPSILAIVFGAIGLNQTKQDPGSTSPSVSMDADSTTCESRPATWPLLSSR